MRLHGKQEVASSNLAVGSHLRTGILMVLEVRTTTTTILRDPDTLWFVVQVGTAIGTRAPLLFRNVWAQKLPVR